MTEYFDKESDDPTIAFELPDILEGLRAPLRRIIEAIDAETTDCVVRQSLIELVTMKLCAESGGSLDRSLSVADAVSRHVKQGLIGNREMIVDGRTRSLRSMT